MTTKKKTKKKVAKKPAKKTAPRKVPAGARDVGYRERKLKEAVGEAQLQADVDEVRGMCCVSGCNRPGVSMQAVSPESVNELPVCAEHLSGSFVDTDGTPFLCGEHGCFSRCVEWIDGQPFCGKHRDELVANLEAFTQLMQKICEQQVRIGEAIERCIDVLSDSPVPYFPEGTITAEDVVGAGDALAKAPLPTMADRYYSEPHVVGEPNTHEEILASDNAVIRENYIASLPRPPERHVYVPPAPGPRPVLPDLVGQAWRLEFHTVRRGLLCDLAFAIIDDGTDLVVVRRAHDRLAGGSTYSLAGPADLDAEQSGEITSHYWHFATDEEHAALAACDPDEPPAASERISA